MSNKKSYLLPEEKSFICEAIGDKYPKPDSRITLNELWNCVPEEIKATVKRSVINRYLELHLWDNELVAWEEWAEEE